MFLLLTVTSLTQKWRHMVAAASTYSDLHMLLSVLDNCIKWERSLDNIVSYRTSYSHKFLHFDVLMSYVESRFFTVTMVHIVGI